MTPEGKVKLAVRNYLKEIKAYYFMPVQMGLGESSLDFLVCHDRRFFAIETKKDEKSMPTPRQLLTAKLVADAGGVPLLVRNADGVFDLLNPYFFPNSYLDEKGCRDGRRCSHNRLGDISRHNYARPARAFLVAQLACWPEVLMDNKQMESDYKDLLIVGEGLVRSLDRLEKELWGQGTPGIWYERLLTQDGDLAVLTVFRKCLERGKGHFE